MQRANNRLQSLSGFVSGSASNGTAACHEQEQVERLLMDMARLREPVCDLDIRDTGVYAKTHLPRGTRYGPFPMRLCQQPSDRHLAWEVSHSTFSNYNLLYIYIVFSSIFPSVISELFDSFLEASATLKSVFYDHIEQTLYTTLLINLFALFINAIDQQFRQLIR